MDPADFIIALTATASEEQAVGMGRKLVEERLAACVNIVPGIRSLYVWKETLCDEGEWILVMKTRKSLFGKLKARILELHGYEVPEIICIPLADGHGPYLQWILDSTSNGIPKDEA
jgi:periplasmic divalent cation tolerance protein